MSSLAPSSQCVFTLSIGSSLLTSIFIVFALRSTQVASILTPDQYRTVSNGVYTANICTGVVPCFSILKRDLFIRSETASNSSSLSVWVIH